MTRRGKDSSSASSSRSYFKVSIQVYNYGHLTRSRLPVACGYNLPDARIAQLNEFLDKRNATRIDVPNLLAALTYLKELEL